MKAATSYGRGAARDGFWALAENGKVRIGITDHLQRTLGDAAFVELQKRGSVVEQRGEIGALETAKGLHSDSLSRFWNN